jgi:hypothetical protein
MEAMETVSEKKEKQPLALGMVTPALCLSKLQTRALFTGVLGKNMPSDADELNSTDFMFLLLADLLEKLPFLQAAQRTLILTEMYRGPFGAGCDSCLNQLVFADERYCTWTKNFGFLDLETGDMGVSPKGVPMETIGYNLNELTKRARLNIEKRNGLHVEKPDAGNVAES